MLQQQRGRWCCSFVQLKSYVIGHVLHNRRLAHSRKTDGEKNWRDTRSSRTQTNSNNPEFKHRPKWSSLWLESEDGGQGNIVGLFVPSYHPGIERGGNCQTSRRLAEYEGTVHGGTRSELCEERQLSEVVEGLHLLVHRGTRIDDSVFFRVLKRCIEHKDLVLGSRVHVLAVKSGYESDACWANHVICMYSSHGRLEEAREVFSKVPAPSRHMWASIIFAHARHGQPKEAIKFYRQMRELALKPHNRIFAAALKACARAGDLSTGREVHADLLGSADKPNLIVSTCLVDMYARCGSLEDARRVFDSLPAKDVVTWNALIAGYARHGLGREALSLYEIMQQQGITSVNHVTFVCLLQACSSIRALHQGKQLHAHIQERGMDADGALGNSLVSMYAKCGSLEDACRVFDNLPTKNVVTWTAMIAGYVEQGLGQEALHLYERMQQEGTLANEVTFACLLQACASFGALRQGKKLHAQIREKGLEADVFVGTCLVHMYVKFGRLEDARRVFDNLPAKDAVTWTAMIGGYAQLGLNKKTLGLYRELQVEGITASHAAAFICLLQACGSVAALEKGKEIHADISKIGLDYADLSVANALIDMYCKCGSMVDSQQIFNQLGRRDVVTWSTLIAGYARHGEMKVVFDLFHRMQQAGIQPDSITFLSLLTVCSHVGLVDQGQRCFVSMIRDYGINPTLEHFTCLVDLFGRAGKVDVAMDMVKTMPFQPDAVVWSSLLGACRKWKNVEVGRKAFERALKLDKTDASTYVSMSNIYAAAKMQCAAKAVQAMRVEAGIWKKPGQSWWTDSSGIVNTFAVGDRDHPEWQHIDAKLKSLLLRMKKEGYVPHLGSVSRDLGDDEKEAALCGHSEKLAIAYALHRTPQGTTIRVVKNLRVCEDCHRATALISKIEQRTIICRDASRFHVYKDGKCSCGDYW